MHQRMHQENAHPENPRQGNPRQPQMPATHLNTPLQFRPFLNPQVIKGYQKFSATPKYMVYN